MGDIDKRNRLEEEPFAYRASKDGKLFISWQNRQIMILKGLKAQRLIAQLEGADPRTAQLLLAKATGHFKHGNER